VTQLAARKARSETAHDVLNREGDRVLRIMPP
jgi:hypothetical protein